MSAPSDIQLTKKVIHGLSTSYFVVFSCKKQKVGVVNLAREVHVKRPDNILRSHSPHRGMNPRGAGVCEEGRR